MSSILKRKLLKYYFGIGVCYGVLVTATNTLHLGVNLYAIWNEERFTRQPKGLPGLEGILNRNNLEAAFCILGVVPALSASKGLFHGVLWPYSMFKLGEKSNPSSLYTFGYPGTFIVQ